MPSNHNIWHAWESSAYPRIRISEFASRDLDNGFAFYELQEEGLGTYFQDSLFADIDSLKLYAGIHSIHLDKYRLLVLGVIVLGVSSFI